MQHTIHASLSRLTQALLAIMILMSITMAGCGGLNRKPKPTPLPTSPVSILPTQGSGGTQVAQPGSTARVITGTVVAGGAAGTLEAAPTGTGGTAVAAAGSETPEACPPPTGWKRHTVRQDETLYYLATSTGASVEEVIKANCLASDLIQIGQNLYLPSVPPLRPTFPPAPPAPPVAAVPAGCTSSFSCTNPNLPPLELASGAPNDPSFVVCDGTMNKPWVSTFSTRMTIGQRFYFFACEFTKPILFAKIVHVDQEKRIDVLAESPNIDLPRGKANAVLTWPAAPEEPTGTYKVVIQGTEGEYADLEFEVLPASENAILVDPVSGPPGTTFSVYYIFGKDANPEIELYGEDNPTMKDHQFTGRDTWKVQVSKPLPGEKEWVMVPLTSLVTDPHSGYMVAYGKMSTYFMFWLK